MQKHQTAMEDQLQKEKKAWRDKMMQHEVRLYSELLSKDCEVTIIYLRIKVILEQLIHQILFINDKYVPRPALF